MKKFNKRPSKAAVNKAIEFYRTEAKNTDEQLTSKLFCRRTYECT